MTKDTTRDTTKSAAVFADILLFDNWFDAIEDGVGARAILLPGEWDRYISFREILRPSSARGSRTSGKN